MTNLRVVSRAVQHKLDKTKTWYLVERTVGLVYDRMLIMFTWAIMSWLIRVVMPGKHPLAGSFIDVPDSLPWLVVLSQAFFLGLPSVLFMALIAVYSVGFIVVYGQTPGMQEARVCLVTNDGLRPRLWRVLARHALSYLSSLAFGLGYAWSLIDRDGRTWHDILSGTRVVRDRDL